MWATADPVSRFAHQKDPILSNADLDVAGKGEVPELDFQGQKGIIFEQLNCNEDQKKHINEWLTYAIGSSGDYIDSRFEGDITYDKFLRELSILQVNSDAEHPKLTMTEAQAAYAVLRLKHQELPEATFNPVGDNGYTVQSEGEATLTMGAHMALFDDQYVDANAVNIHGLLVMRSDEEGNYLVFTKVKDHYHLENADDTQHLAITQFLDDDQTGLLDKLNRGHEHPDVANSGDGHLDASDLGKDLDLQFTRLLDFADESLDHKIPGVYRSVTDFFHSGVNHLKDSNVAPVLGAVGSASLEALSLGMTWHATEVEMTKYLKKRALTQIIVKEKPTKSDLTLMLCDTIQKDRSLRRCNNPKGFSGEFMNELTHIAQTHDGSIQAEVPIKVFWRQKFSARLTPVPQSKPGSDVDGTSKENAVREWWTQVREAFEVHSRLSMFKMTARLRLVYESLMMASWATLSVASPLYHPSSIVGVCEVYRALSLADSASFQADQVAQVEKRVVFFNGELVKQKKCALRYRQAFSAASLLEIGQLKSKRNSDAWSATVSGGAGAFRMVDATAVTTVFKLLGMFPAVLIAYLSPVGSAVEELHDSLLEDEECGKEFMKPLFNVDYNAAKGIRRLEKDSGIEIAEKTLAHNDRFEKSLGWTFGGFYRIQIVVDSIAAYMKRVPNEQRG